MTPWRMLIHVLTTTQQFSMTNSSGLLASKSDIQQKRCNAPSLSSLVVDKEKMRPRHWLWVSALTLVRWQERHPAHKNLCQLSPKVLCWNKWKKATNGNWLTKDHLEQRWCRWQTYHRTTNQHNVLLKKTFQHRNLPLFVHPTSTDFPYM